MHPSIRPIRPSPIQPSESFYLPFHPCICLAGRWHSVKDHRESQRAFETWSDSQQIHVIYRTRKHISDTNQMATVWLGHVWHISGCWLILTGRHHDSDVKRSGLCELCKLTNTEPGASDRPDSNERRIQSLELSHKCIYGKWTGLERHKAHAHVTALFSHRRQNA